MLTPKTPRPSKADEKRAYDLCTERDKGLCVVCHGSDGVQRDHRRNRSQGGLTVLSNLQLLCAADHLHKTDHPAWAYANGFGVPGWADPKLYPAARTLAEHNGHYVRYLDEPVEGVWWSLVSPADAAEWLTLTVVTEIEVT